MKHGFDAGKAFLMVERRVASSSVYRELEAAFRRYAVEGCLACSTVKEFRAAGGRSAIHAAARARAVAETLGAHDDLGDSPMFPMTPAKVLELRRHGLGAEVLVAEFNARNPEG